MPTVEIASGTLHYLDEGSGPPLVLLSANPGESRDYAAVIPALASRYRVLAVDWPGYGRSPMPAQAAHWSAQHLCDVLRAFVDALDLPPVLIVGNSVGGNAAAQLAIDAPHRVRGLVLVAGGGFTPHNVLTRACCRWMGSRWALPPRAWARLYLRRRTPVVHEMLARAGNEQSKPQARVLNRAIWRSFATPAHDLRARAACIAAPVLLLYGRDDPALPASRDGREAARCLPHARFVVMPCGHAGFAELPQVFLDETLPFLAACVNRAIASSGT